MRLSTRFSSVLALALAATSFASDVLDLTPSSFESTVNGADLMLVEFFAPWCGHCKALAPHYEEAATVLKEKSIHLAKVNCVDEAELCQAHGVQGYPTLKVFRNGTPVPYTGPRQADGIISYMTKQALPAVSDVTAANLDEFKVADKIVTVLYVGKQTDAPAPEFSAMAEKHRDDYLFGISTDAAAAEAAGVTPPAIVLYRKFDEPVTEYPYPVPATTVSDLESWIDELAIPLVDQVGAENYATYAASGKPLAYLFVDPTDEKLQDHIALLRPIAKEHKGKLNFAWIDAIKFGDHAKALNLVEPKWPGFVIQDLGEQLKYPIEQTVDLTHDVVKEHVAQYVAGKLTPSLKSQPIPATQDEPVYEVVGKSFEDVVYQEDKDVFIEFYAPWCGHCKRLKPTWDSLGEHFQNVKDQVVIAKMDATENDVPASAPFRVSGFPTLKFKPAGTRDFVEYEGDRSLEALIAYVQEASKNSLTPKESNDTGAVAHDHDHDHDHHDEL